jgi:hypothetical protein
LCPPGVAELVRLRVVVGAGHGDHVVAVPHGRDARLNARVEHPRDGGVPGRVQRQHGHPAAVHSRAHSFEYCSGRCGSPASSTASQPVRICPRPNVAAWRRPAASAAQPECRRVLAECGRPGWSSALFRRPDAGPVRDDTPGDRHRSGSHVDVGPAQPEHFGAAQPGQGQQPVRVQPIHRGMRPQRAQIGRSERGSRRSGSPGWLHLRGRIAGHAPVVERGREDGPHHVQQHPGRAPLPACRVQGGRQPLDVGAADVR